MVLSDHFPLFSKGDILTSYIHKWPVSYKWNYKIMHSFVSGLFSSILCLWNSSILWCVSGLHSFSLLSRNLIYEYATIYLPILLFIEPLVISCFRLLWIRLLRTFKTLFCAHTSMWSIPRSELQVTEYAYAQFWKILPNSFPKWFFFFF